MKKTPVIIIAIVVILGIIYFVKLNTTKVTPTPITPTPVTPTVTDNVLVEQYVRANITTLAPDKPVLGGTWYVTAVTVDPTTTSGTVSYEDGHIASTSNFTYTRNGNLVTISNITKTSK